MLSVRSHRFWSFALACGYFFIAAVLIASTFFAGWRLFGIAGVAGLIIFFGAVVLVGITSIIEDEKKGGFNNPRRPDDSDGLQ